ncbi:MAG TPA: capsule biosynthesis protein [Prevotellaceae bacterium]|jgi:protein involved in polysaccharide export with SLBB domain|nr:capsule biosynthesis protein [Prevotellaceae bacterium]
MKKIIILFLLCPLLAFGQSTMTDSQVASYIQKELAKGTSQSQIVTKLIQKGVDISQIRRIHKAYQQAKDAGMGKIADENNTADVRTRTNNAEDKNTVRESNTSQRIQGSLDGRSEYSENDIDFQNYQTEINGISTAKTNDGNENGMKVFGRDIFNNKDLTFEPIMNIATPQNYRLGPGDNVIIDIYGASQKSISSSVSPDGDIVIENYGPIQVSGLTIAQANSRIKAQLGARYQSSKIKISLGQSRTITVNVMGEVKNPGTYTLSAFASVFHALYMAGGINDLGTLRSIKVYRNSKLVSTCDIYDYILNGKMTGNIRLADGDVISVGPYDCLVTITGKVKRPMIYEMKKDESITSLITYSGGFTGDAYTKAVRVERKTGREYSVFNVEEFDMSAFHVADGDGVTVDSILPRYHNTVEVKGAVFRPGKYQIDNSINSVRSLIQKAEGITEEAFTNHAVIHRMKEDRTLEIVSVDLEGILKGKVADIPLKENDVLFVPSKIEAMVERTISISGEVQYPGIYTYADNETLEDFVLQAGGLTDKASTVKVDVSRRVSNPQATAPDSVIAKTFTFALKEGFIVDGKPGFVLMPFDQVYVRKSPAYSEQKNVSIEGEVLFAGNYTLTKLHSRLTDLIEAAGGPTNLAYIKGARLERIANDAEKTRMKAIYKMQQELLQQQLMEYAISSQKSDNIQQVSEKATEAQLEKFEVPNTFSVGIELDKAIAHPESDANIVLRAGDKLIIPQYTATVKINGAVMYPNAIAYAKGKKAKYYINAAGGYAQNARKKGAYVIYMNGMVSELDQNTEIAPGCEIVVPSKISRKMSVAETMGIGTGIASIATMIATIANLAK